MNRKRFIYVISTILILSCFTFVNFIICKNSNDNRKSHQTTTDSTITQNVDKETIIPYKEYQEFYEYLSKNLSVKGYEKKYSTNHDFINIVDPTWTFNTREKLILPDTDLIQPTDEYMILENKNSTCQITISVCYNQYYIGNNLHSLLFLNNDLNNINHELNNRAVGAVMSYNNILFYIQIGRAQKEDYILSNVLTELCNKVTEYYK